jgi:trans-2,3-dihydro-3-hydroxyanthranilate isomerase
MSGQAGQIIASGWDSFTTLRFGGNPAAVVIGAEGYADGWYRGMAAELNPTSETAFLLTSQSPHVDMRVRYFTRTMEVPFCGHATLAAAYAWQRFMSPSAALPERCTFETSAGTVPLRLNWEGGLLGSVTMQQRTPELAEPVRDVETVARILGVTRSDLNENLPVQAVSTGLWALMVPLRSHDVLSGLQPRFDDMTTYCVNSAVSGFQVFVLDRQEGKGLSAHVRNFGPAVGIREDPVTGSAGGALGAFLASNLQGATGHLDLHVSQGTEMGRGGEMEVEVRTGADGAMAVLVTGSAVQVWEGRLV